MLINDNKDHYNKVSGGNKWKPERRPLHQSVAKDMGPGFRGKGRENDPLDTGRKLLSKYQNVIIIIIITIIILRQGLM